MPQARSVVMIDAPSNLGLRPLVEGVIPGCYKLPWALRDQRLIDRLGASDGGAVVPPPYRAQWVPGEGDRNATGIADYSIKLANRVEALIHAERQVLVLGGDCSILIGNALALKRRGRYGLVYLDAHGDFRHLGNDTLIVAAAGEDLAILTKRGDARLVDLEGRGPYLRAQDVHVAGVRPTDDYLDELTALGMGVTTSPAIRAAPISETARQILKTTTEYTAGFWVHLDVDVIDAVEMPAVDSPEEGGVTLVALEELLGQLLSSPLCVGMEVTIFDPDLDPGGYYAGRLADCLVGAFERARTRPRLQREP